MKEITFKQYKKSKTDFFEAVSSAYSKYADNYEERASYQQKFFESVKFKKLTNLKELVSFLEDLMAINFLEVSAYRTRKEFVSNALKILTNAFNKDPKGYMDFLKEHNTNSPLNLSDTPPADILILSSFLPNFSSLSSDKKSAIASHVENNGLYAYYESIRPLGYELLLLHNREFAEAIYNGYKKSNIAMDPKLIEVLAQTDIVPLNFKIVHNPKLKSIGEHSIGNATLVKTPKYSILKPEQASKKALVIYGFDHNGAFSSDVTEGYLLLKGYEVLRVDARNIVLNIKDITTAIREAGFADLSEVYINMHGSDAMIISDALLRLNHDFSLKSSSQILASTLFKMITAETNGQPIKASVSSCNSQMITHKIAGILPTGSEILTLSENQRIDGKHIVKDGRSIFYRDFEEYIGGDFREWVAKANYHFEGEAADMPSTTYAKIGKCNFRTTINFTQKDLSELFSKTTKQDVTKAVKNYLKNNEKAPTDAEVMTFFDLIETSDYNYPLISCRANIENCSDFNKYLGFAGAIYAMYDQCGSGLITDSDFTPNKDNAFLEEVTHFVFDTMTGFVSDSIVWSVGKVIHVIEGHD